MEYSFKSLEFRCYIIAITIRILQRKEKELKSAAICVAIGEALRIIMKEPLRVEFVTSTECELFPEIQKHKPANAKTFWFPYGDFKSRYDILETAMAELKTQYENANNNSTTDRAE